MDTATMARMMDLLYKKYLIPLVLFDDTDTAIHPAITWDTHRVAATYLQPAKQQKALLFNDFSFMYGVIPFPI
jgi:hypothetical protein